MTAPVLLAIGRARAAWERSQPQTFLEIDFCSLDADPAPDRIRPVSPGVSVEGAEPTAATTDDQPPPTARLVAARADCQHTGRPVRSLDSFDRPRNATHDGPQPGARR